MELTQVESRPPLPMGGSKRKESSRLTLYFYTYRFSPVAQWQDTRLLFAKGQVQISVWSDQRYQKMVHIAFVLSIQNIGISEQLGDSSHGYHYLQVVANEKGSSGLTYYIYLLPHSEKLPEVLLGLPAKIPENIRIFVICDSLCPLNSNTYV